jgi:hypothetical protein
MTILDDFGAELVHDLTRRPFVSEDDYGNVIYGAPIVLKARTDFARRNYINARGQLAESRGESWFYAPGADSRDEFKIHTNEVVQNLDVAPVDDEVGMLYATRLIFG